MWRPPYARGAWTMKAPAGSFASTKTGSTGIPTSKAERSDRSSRSDRSNRSRSWGPASLSAEALVEAEAGSSHVRRTGSRAADPPGVVVDFQVRLFRRRQTTKLLERVEHDRYVIR